jgi:hypothetical protein
MGEFRCGVMQTVYGPLTGHCPPSGPAVAKPPVEAYYGRRFCFSLVRIAVIEDDHQLESLFERRSIGRTIISKSAKLFFNGQLGALACGVRNITNAGAGIRAAGLDLLPLDFELSFDNFRTVRKCRLIWRQGGLIGIAFN